MEIVVKAAQFLTSLSILIILHELGHFIPAKLFGTKVEKFYLFFDPWFSLFKYKKGDTEYGVGWLPLGGYVKISGMVDESMDKEQMKKPPQSWEFRSKPAWQRLIIMLGGVTVNLLLGIFIYAMVLFAYGDKYLPNENLTDGVWVTDSIIHEVGFRNGDKIIKTNDKEIEKFGDIRGEMLYASQVTVERDGREQVLDVPTDFIAQLIDQGDVGLMFYPRIPFLISAIPDTSHNKGAGLQPGDRVISIAGEPVKYFDDAQEILPRYSGQTVDIKVERDDETLVLPLQIKDGEIGVVVAILSYSEMDKLGLYTFESINYTFFESIPAGWNKAMDKLGFYIKQFKLLFNPETGAYKSLGGFGTIGGLFPATWEWQPFWEITAFLSLILAFMNILPIPALDGGHVFFLLYELISGRKPSENVLEKAQIVGMVILFTLLIYANGNDIIRMFK